jgi:alpha-1,6-mannosyltransferase
MGTRFAQLPSMTNATIGNVAPGQWALHHSAPRGAASNGPLFEDTMPQAHYSGPHLLDASMFWTPGGGGGVHRYIAAKRDLLTQVGWRHTLVAPAAHGSDRMPCGGWPIPGSNGYRFVVNRMRAVALIERAEPDIIEAADPYVLGWAALDAAERLNVPTVAFCHSDLPSLVERLLGGRRGLQAASTWAGREAGAYLARLYARFDLVLAPSRSMVSALHALGVTSAQHQPLGVDCTVFRPEARSPAWRDALEQQLELPRGTRVLLYVGRFAAEKNLHLVAEAVRRLGPGHVLLAVGGGPMPPRGAHVRVLPTEQDIHRLARMVASADAFVHAGDQETFGLSVLEAMASGTPVVVSAAGGLGELVQGVGATVASNDPADWADALQASLRGEQPQQLRAAVTRARAHDWTTVLGQLSRRYHLALGTPLRARGWHGAPAGLAPLRL